MIVLDDNTKHLRKYVLEIVLHAPLLTPASGVVDHAVASVHGVGSV